MRFEGLLINTSKLHYSCSFVPKSNLKALGHGRHKSSRSGPLIKGTNGTPTTTIQADNVLETVAMEIPKR